MALRGVAGIGRGTASTSPLSPQVSRMGRLARGMASFAPGPEVCYLFQSFGSTDVTCCMRVPYRMKREKLIISPCRRAVCFHRDKKGFYSQSTCHSRFVTTSAHSPGVREGGRHALAFSSLSALCGARSRASVKLDSDYSRTGREMFWLLPPLGRNRDFCFQSRSRRITISYK